MRAPVSSSVLGTRLPSLTVSHQTPGTSRNTTRLHFDLDTVRPCWGIVALKGAEVHAWSLDAPIATSDDGKYTTMLRVAGNHEAGRRLRMWVEVDQGAVLSVQLTAKYLEPTSHLQRFGAQFAEHVDVTGLTVYHADWEVSATGEVVRSGMGATARVPQRAAGNCSVGVGGPVVMPRMAAIVSS